jgi:hypothetical protein
MVQPNVLRALRAFFVVLFFAEIVANDMRDRLQKEIGGPGAPSSIIQFAAFVKRDGAIVPEFWRVTNIHGMTNGEYGPPQKRS